MDAFSKAPGDLAEALRRYLEHGIEPGSFLMAFLCNDVMAASLAADDKNIHLFKELAIWLLSYAPGESFGSPENVAKWLATRRRLRIVT